MWIFLNNSYLSIVRHRDEPDQLLVRARNNGDIEAVFPRAIVKITPQADYLFRAVIDESLVAATIKTAILDIDYDNFKDSIADARYHDTCLNVWLTMSAHQRNETYQRNRINHAKKKKK